MALQGALWRPGHLQGARWTAGFGVCFLVSARHTATADLRPRWHRPQAPVAQAPRQLHQWAHSLGTSRRASAAPEAATIPSAGIGHRPTPRSVPTNRADLTLPGSFHAHRCCPTGSLMPMSQIVRKLEWLCFLCGVPVAATTKCHILSHMGS